MESFVLSRKDCRAIYWKIYFLIVQLVAVNFVIAWLMTYVDNISIWFDDYTQENVPWAFTPLAHFLSLAPFFLMIVYTFRQIGHTFKMTFINLLVISLAIYTHKNMLDLGWEFIIGYYIAALIAMGILIFSATMLKIKLKPNYKSVRFVLMLLWTLFLISLLINDTIAFIVNLLISLYGLCLVFFETQKLRSRLLKVRTQPQLDNLIYPFIINMIGNFFLINFYFDVVKLFIKYFSIDKD